MFSNETSSAFFAGEMTCCSGVPSTAGAETDIPITVDLGRADAWLPVAAGPVGLSKDAQDFLGGGADEAAGVLGASGSGLDVLAMGSGAAEDASGASPVGVEGTSSADSGSGAEESLLFS